MKKIKSQIQLLDHSEAKVKLYGDYIQKYLNIICNDGYTKKIHLFDLFCGPGVYQNKGEGSPVIALRKIKNTYFQFIDKRPDKLPKINCYYNDIDEKVIQNLKEYIINKKLHHNSYGKLSITTSDYISAVKKLSSKLKTLKQEKAFIFIDPYGYKEVKAEHILNLLDCGNKSEVLLWLPIQFMYRFSEAGTPEVLKNFNSQIGIANEGDKFKNVWEYIFALKEGLRSFMGEKYYVDHFSLKKDENTVFCLFFFSSHIRGYEKMLETKWDIDKEQGRGWEYTGNMPDLFSSQKTNKLEELLKLFLRERDRTNSEIFEFTLRKGYLSKHSNQVLKQLLKNNSIEVVKNDPKSRNGAFYIDYKNYKKYPNKISIKLK